MKNLLLYCALFISISVSAQTNPTWWLAPGAFWSYETISSGGIGQSYYQYAGDTLYEGLIWSKLDAYYQTNLGSPSSGFYNYYIRVENDRVFYKFNIDDEEMLLYDFTLQPGDTMAAPHDPWGWARLISTDVVSIQDVPFRRQTLEVFTFNDLDTVEVVEFIGGPNLINWDVQCFEACYFLHCFSDDNLGWSDCSPLAGPDNYKPIPLKSNAVEWYEYRAQWCNYQNMRYIADERDTLIEGVGFGKPVYYQQLNYGSDPCPNGYFNELQDPLRFIGILRQDVLNKKIWFKPLIEPYLFTDMANEMSGMAAGEEILLYDFDIETGDILTWKAPPQRVTYIDEVMVNNTPRRRIHFDDPQQPYDPEYFWIEGIGANRGLFGSYHNPFYTDQSVQLTCYRVLDTTGIILYTYGDCIVEANERPSIAAQVEIYPNPSYDGHLSIILPDDWSSANIEMIDVHGRTLARHTVSGSTPLNIEQAPAGLYFIKISLPDGRSGVKKWIMAR